MTVRILTQCSHCHRQYDVSGLAPGAHARCHCGTTLSIPQPRVQEARLVRCPSCGAARGSADTCDFCSARFSAVDKGWGSMCPSCFVRLPNDASYCVECGIKIDAMPLNAGVSEKRCPRCGCNLNPRAMDKLAFDECAACGGIWLNADAFAAVCKDRETQAVATQGMARRSRLKFELSAAEQVKYIPCPQCRELMNRRNFAEISGVVIDTCKEHGVWLDNQELNRVVQFIENGGLQRSQERKTDEAVHRAKMAANSGRGGAGFSPLPLGTSIGTRSSSTSGVSIFAEIAEAVVWSIFD